MRNPRQSLIAILKLHIDFFSRLKLSKFMLYVTYINLKRKISFLSVKYNPKTQQQE